MAIVAVMKRPLLPTNYKCGEATWVEGTGLFVPGIFCKRSCGLCPTDARPYWLPGCKSGDDMDHSDMNHTEDMGHSDHMDHTEDMDHSDHMNGDETGDE